MTGTPITQHFTAEEAVVTSTGIPNVVSSEEVTNRILNTATNMELVRALLGRKPITVNSWYRSPRVNAAVGGVAGSEHLTGAAVDFVCPAFGDPYSIVQSLMHYDALLNYNQLIYENTWVHISFPPDGQQGKRQVLTLVAGRYVSGLLKK